MSVRATIVSQFEVVAGEQQRRLAPLTDDLKLLQSGLDSLSFAIIVARLEDKIELGFDPFNAEECSSNFRSRSVTSSDSTKIQQVSPMWLWGAMCTDGQVPAGAFHGPTTVDARLAATDWGIQSRRPASRNYAVERF